MIKSESTYRSVKDFLESIVPGSVTNQLALLKNQDKADRWTPLALATVEHNRTAVQEILEFLPKEEIWSHLKQLTLLGNTVVQIAARWNYVDVIEKVLNSFEGASNEAECIHYLLLDQNKEGKMPSCVQQITTCFRLWIISSDYRKVRRCIVFQHKVSKWELNRLLPIVLSSIRCS